MKNFTFLMIATLLTGFFVNTASAQSGYAPNPNSATDQFQDLMVYYRQYAERNMLPQKQKIVVDCYRNQTGDVRTSDAQILEKLWQDFITKNPGFVEAVNRQHQQRMNDINRAGQESTRRHNQRMQDMDTSHANYMNSQNSSHAAHQNYVNNAIWEQGQYVNPGTGQTAVIPWNQANTFYTGGGNQYYTDGNYRQYQHDGQGWWSEMSQIDW